MWVLVDLQGAQHTVEAGLVVLVFKRRSDVLAELPVHQLWNGPDEFNWTVVERTSRVLVPHSGRRALARNNLDESGIKATSLEHPEVASPS